MKTLLTAVVLLFAFNAGAQTITPKSTIKTWFETGDKPTQDQYYKWMDAYWHKSEMIPAAKISGLDSVTVDTTHLSDRINLKVDSVTTNSDSTILRYWVNGVAHNFYDVQQIIFDTTSVPTDSTDYLDSTGRPQNQLLFAGPERKILSDSLALYDPVNHRIIINNPNISFAADADKLAVDGRAYMKGLKLDIPVANENNYITIDPITKVARADTFIVLKLIRSDTFALRNDSLFVDTTASSGGGDVTTEQLADTAEAIRADFPVVTTDGSTTDFTVINVLNAPPGSPAVDDQYRVGTSPTGAWLTPTNLKDNIVRWNGSSWDPTAPTVGDYVYQTTDSKTYQYKSDNTWHLSPGIPIINNRQSISNGMKIGLKNNKSLSLWTNNIERGGFLNSGGFYLNGLGNGTAGTDSLLVTSAGVTKRIAAATYRTQSQVRSDISLTTTGSGAATYNSSTGVLNVPTPAAVSASAGYTLHGTGSGVYQDAIIYKDTAKNWVAINKTTPTSLFDVYPTFPGAVSPNSGSASLLGSNTRFQENFRPGDKIIINGTNALVLSISSQTSLTLDAPFGSTQSNVSYTNGSPGSSVFSVKDNGDIYQYGGLLARNMSPENLRNTSFGSGAMGLITTGLNNAAFGFEALRQNTTGSNNTALGRAALLNNTSGGGNSAFGFNALTNNTTGDANMAVGYASLFSNTNGQWNTAIGAGALYANTTGGFNVAFGTNAMESNTSGSGNISFCPYSLDNNQTGNFNFAGGYTALRFINAKDNNIALGAGAGSYLADASTHNTSTSNSVFIGANTYPLGNTDVNTIVIGQDATGNGSNTFTLGKTGTDTYVSGKAMLTGGAVFLAKAKSNASTLTLTTATSHWSFYGTTATWTLPALSSTQGVIYYIKNRGSGTLTINAAGSDSIYDTSASSSITVAAGASIILFADPDYWTKE